ncbi:hypothetical protein [Rubrolithibacter danxiaensis]|uniref:hypothetical protein n=1 Tax=Rubrolithibacter danxiaensis TaxID=3390805 RepID=UPI003BF7F4A2
MKFPVLHVKHLPVPGMALFPFILLKEKKYKLDPVFINHEKIHLIQQLELLIIPFYLLYLLNYIVNLLRFKNHFKAYMNIVFEKEAYAEEKKLRYIKSRKLWAWLHYF